MSLKSNWHTLNNNWLALNINWLALKSNYLVFNKFISWIFLPLLFLSGCTRCSSNHEPLGSKENPIKFAIVPVQDLKLLGEVGPDVEAWLNSNSKHHFSVKIPNTYIAVVEALGSKKADFAIINSFGYLLAYERYPIETRMTILVNGKSTYRGQIIARVNGPKELKDIQGKKFAYVDPTSTSGYLVPSYMLKSRNINPFEIVFAGRHDSVVSMVYEGQVDAGATFHNSEIEDGIPQDARRLILTQHPDVFEKIKILELTDEILYDPIVFRKELPEGMKDEITKLLFQFIESETGKKTFTKLFKITGFREATDDDYIKSRTILKEMQKVSSDIK